MESKVGGRYHVRRCAIYRIYSVSTVQKPYLYRLQDIETKKVVSGWYYGRELARADLSDLEIERVLRKKTVNKKKFMYVKFKDLDDSYNRWIEPTKEK